MARHFRRFHTGLAEVAQPLQAHARLLDGGLGSRGTLHLAHLAAQHLVGGLLVALETDAAHIGALAGIDKELQGDRLVLLVDLGNAGYLGKIVAVIAQPPGHELLGGGNQLLGEGLSFLDQDIAAQILFGQHQIPRQADFADGELVALGHVGGDVDLALVRRHGHLGGVDAELQVAAVHVEGCQGLQVTGELLATVLVVAGDEGEPAGGLELEQVGQLLVVKHLVADDVDVFDGGHGAFIHIDVDGHAIARLRQHFGIDVGIVATLLHVLALQFELHALQGGTLEYLTHGQAGPLQTLEQGLGLDGLVALDIDLADAGSLHHHDHQHVAVPANADVIKVAGGEEAARRGLQGLLVDQIPDRQRHGREHRAGRDALQALDTDVGHDE